MLDVRTETPFGVLNIYKPAGMTSRDVVDVVERLVRPARCGHAGTLDPMATGVLLVCVGPATRLITLLQKSSKRYRAEFTLGIFSDTDDSTGQIEAGPVLNSPPAQPEIERRLQAMTGLVQQVPPVFSAVHVGGRRAYARARKGEQFSIEPKWVQIDSIQIVNYEWPRLEVDIQCGSGTYIRSIARDLGRQLGSGGLMSQLERTSIGDFDSQSAIILDQIREQGVSTFLLPPVQITATMPYYLCNGPELEVLVCGKVFPIDRNRLKTADVTGVDLGDEWSKLIALRMETDGGLAAFAERDDVDGVFRPRMVFLRKGAANVETNRVSHNG